MHQESCCGEGNCQNEPEEICEFFPVIGKTIPNLEFDYYQKENFHKAHFSDYRGKWAIVFFYPADFTFVCPTELEEMQKNYQKFQELGAEVLSVSTDTKFTHKAWHDHSPAIKQLEYPMIADPSGDIAETFGVLIHEGDDRGLALRGTFIIDPDGVLQAYEVHSNNVGRSADELLRKLEAAIFVREHHGEVCPASWKKGSKTLKPGIDLVGKI
ncbi:MAG: peroxiredoxin [Candidatus Moranbacteria bacterium CG_4_10_14_3_um_filter_45_9]|nr:MAG: peroxiredoxin [Candidatus Moranbacteria bacterium CG_4_10_14_3_um_filter_45_9]